MNKPMNETFLCPICSAYTTGRCQDPECLDIREMHNAWSMNGNRVLRRAIDVGAARKRRERRITREMEALL